MKLQWLHVKTILVKIFFPPTSIIEIILFTLYIHYTITFYVYIDSL